jgi:hypothetical protein
MSYNVSRVFYKFQEFGSVCEYFENFYIIKVSGYFKISINFFGVLWFELYGVCNEL